MGATGPAIIGLGDNARQAGDNAKQVVSTPGKHVVAIE